jgi:hypothetical protein
LTWATVRLNRVAIHWSRYPRQMPVATRCRKRSDRSATPAWPFDALPGAPPQ